MRRLRQLALITLLVVLSFIVTPKLAAAHQPFFEDSDFTAAKPGNVPDPTISTALYGTLENRSDVDYVTFRGRKGQSILIGLTIPQIEGQTNFTPTLALIGPGLPKMRLSQCVTRPKGEGATLLRAAPGVPKEFYEPFSRTRYWERQEKKFLLPADGRYTVAVWNERGDVGRYTLVVGDREVIGGDPAFPFKLRAYWTPVNASQDLSGGCEK